MCHPPEKSVMVGRIMASQRYPHANPTGTYEFYLTCKRDFAEVVKLKILRQRDYSGLFRWVKHNHQGPYKRKAGGSV